METLPSSSLDAATSTTATQTPEKAAEPPAIQPSTLQEKDAPAAQSKEETTASTTPAAEPRPAPPTDMARTETEAIGPSTDTPATKPDNTNGPVVVITLLLTTGARHPYKIDEKYLKKRNVNVEAMDPYNISVYTLKELIWRDWREGTSLLSERVASASP
jgi:hypothetical protein